MDQPVNQPAFIENEAREAASFVGARWISNAVWVGGTILSIAAQEKLGVPWPAAVSVVGVTAGTIEYEGSNITVQEAAEVIPQQPLAENATRAQRIGHGASLALRETVATGYAAWSGAMSAVEVNSLVGLESTPTRRKVQSATYGAAVSAWGLPFMRQTAISAVEIAWQHPVEAGATAAVGSTALYGLLKFVRWGIGHFQKDA